MITIGLDLPKHVFQVHGVDAAAKTRVRRQLRRGDVVKFLEGLSPCLVGAHGEADASGLRQP